MKPELRVVPAPVGLSADFYAWCARGELRFQRCDDCGAWRHPPRLTCSSCGSPRASWTQASGRGRVWSWTITHQAFDPAFADELPYAVVVVETDEGPRLVGNLRDLDATDLRVGLAVAVVLERVSDAVALLAFRPDGGDDATTR